ncbi:hypothetical protein MIR68_009357 [Amoeboaphelidium protococcarum]|nr:hypothetical protein MIR68_009357 [Amoeboaphelidium protococcarum]
MTQNVKYNESGIPQAPFVDEVEKFLSPEMDAQALLRKFDEMLSTYKRMEVQLQAKKQNLNTKIPELEKSLEAVRNLIASAQSEDTGNQHSVRYELSDAVYAMATVDKPVLGDGESATKVGIWLGANIMVEYTLKEAEDLLADKRQRAAQSLELINSDLEYLREQITIVEVNLARVYNYEVSQRRRKSSQPIST